MNISIHQNPASNNSQKILSGLLAVVLFCATSASVFGQFRFNRGSSGRSFNQFKSSSSRLTGNSSSSGRIQNRQTKTTRQSANSSGLKQSNSVRSSRSITRGIVNPPVKSSRAKSTRENWSTADRLLNRSKKSRVDPAKNSTSPFSSRDIRQAGTSRSGIFPGERGQSRNSGSSRTRGNQQLADMITGRIPKGNQNPSQRNTKSQSGKSDVSSNPSQPSRAPIRLSDAIAERLGGNDSRQNPGRGDNGVPSPRGTRAESENSSDNAGRGNSVGTQEERIAAKEEKNKGNDVSDPRRPNNSSLLDQLSNPGNGRRESDDSETGGMDNREESASTETQQPAPVEDDPNENDQTVNEEETDVDEQQTPLDPGYENQPNDNQQQCPPSVRDIVIGIIDRIDRNSGPVIVESSSDIIVVPSVEPEPAVSAPVQRRIRTDLEVVDIRFVDFGDRDKNTGPSFKVCVRNHNNKFAANDVDVALVAAIDLDDANQGRVAETASIESIGPRQTVEIEIRLPRKSYELATRDGQTAIFSEMAAIVDPDEKFMDVRPDNNLMIRDIDDIEMDE